ncbi:hypothetical protein MAM1_0037c02717 [Mucor ambiguus]|uniref:Uncharacterized protein n=1 Tax=Mucor ambiguus TaxID=91626 RepID=A0A0C9LT03_9FUNG|nr:hypothetical protein MAM1_0037c02717 [Mucor ambiguus]
MVAISIFVALFSLLFFDHAYAYYGDFFNRTFDIPSLNLGTSVAIADAIYILGGVKADYSNARNWDITTLKFDSQQNAITSTITNTEPQLNRDISHAYHLGDNKTIVLANVQYPNFNVTNAQSNTTVELRTSGISFYDIPSNTWTNPQISLAVQPLPPLRKAAMSAISPENDAIYVMGGFYVTLFDTRKNQIYTQNVSGISPTPRFAAGSALGPDKSTIYYYGGGDQVAAKNPLTGVAVSDLVALDTTTWAWVHPEVSGLAAASYIYSTLTLFENTKLVTAIGLVGSVYINDIGVINNVPQSASELQDSNMQWVTNNKEMDKYSGPAYRRKKQDLSEGAIAGITVAVLLIIILLLALLWRRFPRIRAIGTYIQNEIIWQPRSGEPLWAETARLLVRFILFFLFIAFVAYSIYRSVQSPVVVQDIKEPTDTVQVPDIRFCYDGFNVSSTALPLNVFCAFRNGTDCSNQIQTLNMTKHSPKYPDQLGPVACFMFLSAPSYSLINDNMGYSESTSTKMVFSFQGPYLRDSNGNISASGAIYIDMYPPGYNPNVVAYGLLPTNQLTREYNREWAISEQGSNTIESIILKPSVRTSASFAITENRVLRRSDGWNYVGFSSTYDSC